MSPTPSSSLHTEVDHAAVVRRLQRPEVFPDRPQNVRLVETHISHVFLTDRFVYKLKKPARFEFLDFSTLELRERACREELRLNRRMTRDVYLAVLPVTQEASGELTIDGAGRVADWLVQMRRLPADRMLDELIREHRLTDVDVAQLADFLARYYAAADPLIVRPGEFHASLIAHTEANFRELSAESRLDATRVRRIHTPQLRLLKSRPELFQARALDGRVIDGHGDLRPEHICLTVPPVVFDCLEFSADLRRVDILDELCFLAMECDALDCGVTGKRILDTYLAQSQDGMPEVLTTFYKCYRACVRAKVAALRARQLSTGEGDAQQLLCERYLDLADGYLSAAGTRPLLVLVTGLMGTGKSTLARNLAEALAAETIRTDDVRRELFPGARPPAAFGEGRYRHEARAQVYDEVLQRAERRLAAGVSVILDGTFGRAATRDAVIRRCLGRGCDVAMVECVCPREVALKRITSRLHAPGADSSEARPELYDLQAAAFERSTGAVGLVAIDTTQTQAEQTSDAFRALPPPLSGRRPPQQSTEPGNDVESI